MTDLDAVTTFQLALEEAEKQITLGCDLTEDQIDNIIQTSLPAGMFPSFQNFKEMVSDPDVDTEAVLNKLRSAHTSVVM